MAVVSPRTCYLKTSSLFVLLVGYKSPEIVTYIVVSKLQLSRGSRSAKIQLCQNWSVCTDLIMLQLIYCYRYKYVKTMPLLQIQ